MDVHQLFKVVEVVHTNFMDHREGVLFFDFLLVCVEDAAVVQDVGGVDHVQDVCFDEGVIGDLLGELGEDGLVWLGLRLGWQFLELLL